MTVDWSKLAKVSYWLEGIAGESSKTPVISESSDFFWFYLYFFSILAVLGIFARLLQAFLHDNHPLQQKLPLWGNNITIMGLLGLAWFTCRQLSVGFFGARFWLLFGMIWFLYIAFIIIKYFLTFFRLELAYFHKNYLK